MVLLLLLQSLGGVSDFLFKFPRRVNPPDIGVVVDKSSIYAIAEFFMRNHQAAAFPLADFVCEYGTDL
jgi:hypothetical protein